MVPRSPVKMLTAKRVLQNAHLPESQLGKRLPAGAHLLDGDGQVLWAAQQRALPVGRWVYDQSRLHQAPQQLREGDLGLCPREGRTKAAMDAAAEPEMLVVAPLRVEAVRV